MDIKMEKPQWLSPNLESRGRIVRAAGAAVTATVSAILWHKSAAVGIGLAVAAGFLAFEAGRGWCALRACKIKTKF
jgi:hypothetical protein